MTWGGTMKIRSWGQRRISTNSRIGASWFPSVGHLCLQPDLTRAETWPPFALGPPHQWHCVPPLMHMGVPPPWPPQTSLIPQSINNPHNQPSHPEQTGEAWQYWQKQGLHKTTGLLALKHSHTKAPQGTRLFGHTHAAWKGEAPGVWGCLLWLASTILHKANFPLSPGLKHLVCWTWEEAITSSESIAPCLQADRQILGTCAFKALDVPVSEAQDAWTCSSAKCYGLDSFVCSWSFTQ